MSPKKYELSSSTRDQIILLRNMGQSYREIGKTLKINFSSVRCVIKRFNERGNTDNLPRKGRPRVLTPRECRSIIQQVHQEPSTSAMNLVNVVELRTGKKISESTVKRVLCRAEIHARTPRKKPFISEVNRKKRLGFAHCYVGKSNEFWENVLFSDESKFNIFGSDGRKYVWRKAGQALNPKNVIPTVKHGGGHVMVWGCVSFHGVGKLAVIESTMNAEMYVDVLRQNLLSSVQKLGIENSYIFQQDRDPKHTAQKTKEWLLYNVRSQLHTPPQSPDINIIENLWHKLDVEIRKRKFSNKHQLKSILFEEWEKISPHYIKSLVLSMPRRLQAIIDANGLHTKY